MDATVDERTYSVDTDGFAIVRDAVDQAILDQLSAEIGDADGAGRRRMLAVPGVAAFARSDALQRLLRPYFANEPVAVRGLFFNKSAEANWFVAWHQDVTIAVRERREVPGFGPWTVKDGVVHVQPLAELLARMLALRIHFDDADESNGALRIVSGSHRFGRLSAERVEELRSERPEVLCCVRTGDAVLMRPLALHASHRSTNPRPRRVLHLEFADFVLPGGLQWHDAA